MLCHTPWCHTLCSICLPVMQLALSLKNVCRTLGGQEDGAVSYGRFRRFAILLPPERLTVMDPGLAWFEAATVMPPCELMADRAAAELRHLHTRSEHKFRHCDAAL